MRGKKKGRRRRAQKPSICEKRIMNVKERSEMRIFFLIGNQKAIINERKMKKQEVHDDEQQEIKETNITTNRG